MRIYKKDLIVERIKGSGPGGQHRNKKATGIRLRHQPSGVVVTAMERRSQAANLKVALSRLRERLQKKYLRKKPRKKTRPSRKSKEERLRQKKLRSRLKESRKKVI